MNPQWVLQTFSLQVDGHETQTLWVKPPSKQQLQLHWTFEQMNTDFTCHVNKHLHITFFRTGQQHHISYMTQSGGREAWWLQRHVPCWSVHEQVTMIPHQLQGALLRSSVDPDLWAPCGEELLEWRRIIINTSNYARGDTSWSQCNPLGVNGDILSRLISASQSSRSQTESVAFSLLWENCEILSKASSCSIHSTTLGIMLT